MKLFFDTEFTGLHKDTTLISIGIISEDGKSFYAEFNDYDRTQVNEWIQENVIYNLYLKDTVKCMGDDWTCPGNKSTIVTNLKKWLSQFDEVQFISDVCHYDFVLLIDLFGDAFSLPKNVSPVCYDINQDIAKKYNISQKDAFDMSREEIVCKQNTKYSKHNALHDAAIIKLIYQTINQ